MKGYTREMLEYTQSLKCRYYCDLVEDGTCSDCRACVFRNASQDHVENVISPSCKFPIEQVLEHLREIDYGELV